MSQSVLGVTDLFWSYSISKNIILFSVGLLIQNYCQVKYQGSN